MRCPIRFCGWLEFGAGDWGKSDLGALSSFNANEIALLVPEVVPLILDLIRFVAEFFALIGSHVNSFSRSSYPFCIIERRLGRAARSADCRWDFGRPRGVEKGDQMSTAFPRIPPLPQPEWDSETREVLDFLDVQLEEGFEGFSHAAQG